MFKLPCIHKLRLNRYMFLHFLSIVILIMKLVQQYGRLNTITMVIIVLIFITMDMQMFYQWNSQV